MTHLKSFIKKEYSEMEDSFEYNINDIDNPNGWTWKEIDWLANMGFEPEGETRLTYTDKDTTKNVNHSDLRKDPLKVTVYKNKQGYWLLINNRKHVFRTFTQMMNFIDDRGSVPL